VLKLRKLW